MKVTMKLMSSAWALGFYLLCHAALHAYHSFSSYEVVKAKLPSSVAASLSSFGITYQGDPIEKEAKNGVSLLHVIPPYEVKDCLEQFCPYDQAQSVTIGSMLRAQGRVGKDLVTLAAAAYQEEISSIVPDGFQALQPGLKRSTKTEYPSIPGKKAFPFIQDIIDLALSYDNGVDKFDYIIYTNADIILHDDFYRTVQDIIATEGYDFFTINRRQVPKNREEGDLYTVHDLDAIYSFSDYQTHPGTDCFIMKRSVVRKLNLQDVFLGFPFIANSLNLQGKYHAKKSMVYASDDLQATYHLGDDQAGRKYSQLAYAYQNGMNAICNNELVKHVCSTDHILDDRPEIKGQCNSLQVKMKRWVDAYFDFGNESFCGKRITNISLPSNKVKLVFAMGIEGTGHHFLSDLHSRSPLAKIIKKNKKVRKVQLEAANLLRYIYQLVDLEAFPDTLAMDPAYALLVTKFGYLSQLVETEISPLVPENGAISIHVNVLDGVKTSFPSTQETARYTQLPDLGIFYHACQDAGVGCGHILMTRDAHEVIRSTTVHRSFDAARKQVVNLSMQINMMISQALQYSEKLVGCFDYNDPALHIDQWVGNNMFGWNTDDNSLQEEIRSIYSATGNIADSDRKSLTPAGFQVYMQAMLRATEYLRFTCQSQLLDSNNKTKSNPELVNIVSMNNAEESKETPNVLRPPFKIVQVGAGRTGSTFQFQLLRAIATLKSGAGAEIQAKFLSRSDWKDGNPFEELMSSDIPFVLKTHHLDERLEKASRSGAISVFSSSDIVPYSVYTQERSNLEDCSACEIERYQPIFDLTDSEVSVLKKHMHNYEILRKCCGFQMSKYEVLRLNGCDVSEYVDQPDYPHCERYDLAAVELSFVDSPIQFHEIEPQFNWAAPGDCARFNAEIANGKTFNGRHFDDCSLEGKWQRRGIKKNGMSTDADDEGHETVHAIANTASDKIPETQDRRLKSAKSTKSPKKSKSSTTSTSLEDET